MRTLPRFGPERMKELERAWRRAHDERGRKRLQVLRLVAQHKLTAGEIAQAAGVGRWTVFNYVRKFQEGGVEKLLATGYAQRPARGRLDAA
ncbi:MAG: helix-turn-helix domain-containing protein, partial [Opitutaceae bacterium]|nr:helix-turn-helix domain-containing protein [Opitutaceae bacterium]